MRKAQKLSWWCAFSGVAKVNLCLLLQTVDAWGSQEGEGADWAALMLLKLAGGLGPGCYLDHVSTRCSWLPHCHQL